MHPRGGVQLSHHTGLPWAVWMKSLLSADDGHQAEVTEDDVIDWGGTNRPIKVLQSMKEAISLGLHLHLHAFSGYYAM